MAARKVCSVCQGKRTVVCPCCAGKGWVLTSPYPPFLGKAHTCIDCTGLGEIPCPQCQPSPIDIPIGKLRLSPKQI